MMDAHTLPASLIEGTDAWIVSEEQDSPNKCSFCTAHGIECQVVALETLVGSLAVPTVRIGTHVPGQRRVVVTGCFDWLHAGHLQFFAETAALGELCVVLGHDQNVALLKGDGHLPFQAATRRYMVQSIRYVKEALVSSGEGWIDAAPEIVLIQPQIYAVNEDGDRREKRASCAKNGIEYVVLRRLPKDGLPSRTSRALRGF